MKISIFVSCCILTFHCVSVHGDLQIGLGGIQKAATKVKQDVKSLFNIKSNNEDSIVFKDSEEEFPVVSTSKAPEVTPVASVQRGGDVEMTTTTVITTTAGNSNATEKDGRENFAAGCATGFMRTADGRCKPTF